MTRRFRITMEITTDQGDPSKWQWDELILSEPNESLDTFRCQELDEDGDPE